MKKTETCSVEWAGVAGELWGWGGETGLAGRQRERKGGCSCDEVVMVAIVEFCRYDGGEL